MILGLLPEAAQAEDGGKQHSLGGNSFPFLLSLLVEPNIWPSLPPQLLQMLQAKVAQAGMTRDTAEKVE